MQVKNRRESIFIDKPPAEILSIEAIEDALDDDGYVTTEDLSDYVKTEDLPIATDEVAGMVKIGEGVTVTADGTISVSGGGSVELVEIASGFGNFTFPSGKTIADYQMLIIAGVRSGYTDVMTTLTIPTAILSANNIAFPLWFNGSLNNEIYVTATGTANKTSGQMVVSKVYAM